MFGLRHASMLLVVTPLALCLTGCEISHHSITPVEVLVLDAESAAPLSDVTVSIDYPHPKVTIMLNMPKDISVDTGTDGRVALGVADFERGYIWTVSATGYPSVRWEENWRQQVGWPVPAGLRDMFNEERARREITVYLYCEPPPQITVIVPTGYRGPVKLDLRPMESFVQGAVGQREFTFEADENGYVGVDAAPLLLRSLPWDVVFRYTDGSRIRRWGEVTHINSYEKITVHGFGPFGSRWLFMIGTKAEADALYEQVLQHVTDPYPRIVVNRVALDALFSE